MAVKNIALQAAYLGLVTHMMAGFDGKKAIDTLGIPQNMIAVGYPGKLESLTHPLQVRELAPRSRKPIQEIAYSRQWEEGFPLCFT